MNLQYAMDESFQQSVLYQSFLKDNPGKGNLKIRAFMGNEVMPINGLKVIVSTVVDDNRIVFFEGNTDSSGMIQTLSLPTPVLLLDNMEVPNSIIYEVEAIDEQLKVDQFFQVRMYDGICVIQNIEILPNWRDS